METIKGFKGFDKDLKCRDFQYKEGETYETDQKPVRCTENGFHFCLEPLDILAYYAPADSVFHHVEGFGESSADDNDSKIAVSKIKIGAQIGIAEFVKLSFEAIFKRCKENIKENSGYRSMASNSGDSSMASNSGDSSMASNSGDSSMASNSGYSSMASNSGDSSMASNSGDRSMASNSGYRSMASNSGDRSMASNSGDSSMASNSGYSSMASNSGDSSMASNSGDSSMASNSGDRSMASNSGYRSMASNSGYSSMASNSGDSSMASVDGINSIAIAFGISSKAKASLNSYITVSEWEYKGNNYILKGVKTVKIDGKRYKADTFYKLENNKIIKAE